MSTAKLLTLKILSPEGTLLKADGLRSVNVPLADGGAIGIRPGHAPLIAETAQGTIRYRTQSERHQVEILPGILDITENTITILTAGEVNESSLEAAGLPDSEYTRLIQDLAHRFYPENDKPKDTD